PTVRRLERAARPKSRWARPWFLRKVRVPPTTNTGATSLHSESVSKDETKDLAAFSYPRAASGGRAHPSGPWQRRHTQRGVAEKRVSPRVRESRPESPGRPGHCFLERCALGHYHGFLCRETPDFSRRRRTVVAERRIHFGRRFADRNAASRGRFHARSRRKRRSGNCHG